MVEQCIQKPRMFYSCEFIGSIFLVIAAVAPMILFFDSAPVTASNILIAIVADALAVGFVLFALIEIFGPICTSYFNPVVTFANYLNKEIKFAQLISYSLTQVLGGIIGIMLCHLMFYDKISKVIVISSIERSGGAYLGEALGTFILVLCIISLVHQKNNRVSLVVGLLVGGMLLSTSSTMFANPQVTIARMLTYSVAGVRPIDGAVFILVQFLAAALAVLIWQNLIRKCARVC